MTSPPNRPGHLVAVVGTATEVGKTWVSGRVLEVLRRNGHTVAARKPVQSFDPDDPGPMDAAVLAAATGEEPALVCPEHRWYPVPMAPPMAAEALGRPRLTLADLVAELRWPPGVGLGLVETVGGVRSPIAHDADSRDLVSALRPDVVLVVADAALGTIDRVRCAVDAVGPAQPLVFLNRFDPDDDLHRRNRAWLADDDRLDVVVEIDELADRLDALRGTSPSQR